MAYYQIIFTNVAPVTVYAANNTYARREAARQTRGYLSQWEQEQKIISCKLRKDLN